MTDDIWAIAVLGETSACRLVRAGRWLAVMGPRASGADAVLSAPDEDDWVLPWLASLGDFGAVAHLGDRRLRVWATAPWALGTDQPGGPWRMVPSDSPIATWALDDRDVVLALTEPATAAPTYPLTGVHLVRGPVEAPAAHDGPLRPGARVHDPARRRRAQPPPAQVGEFSLIDLFGDPETRPPLPDVVPAGAGPRGPTTPGPDTPPVRTLDVVDGKRCRVGHFNHPLALYCHRCGRGFAATGTHVADRAPRPPLGVLVDESGVPHPVDRRIVVGRTPIEDDDVAAGQSLAVRVTDPAVSRVHLELRADGWDLMAIDRSTNGSRYWTGARWLDLPHGEPSRVAPGSTLQVGAAQFRYLSHHVANDVAEPDA